MYLFQQIPVEYGGDDLGPVCSICVVQSSQFDINIINKGYCT